jgi:hypothetical protein
LRFSKTIKTEKLECKTLVENLKEEKRIQDLLFPFILFVKYVRTLRPNVCTLSTFELSILLSKHN